MLKEIIENGERQKIFPQNQDKLGMRAEASEACMRGDAILIEDG